MTTNAGYGSPGAFRRALTDRLRVIARESRWTLPHSNGRLPALPGSGIQNTTAPGWSVHEP